MSNFNRRRSSVTRYGPTNSQNLRRSDVTDNAAKRVTSSYVRPKVERQSTEMWQAPVAEGVKANVRRVVKESKLSLVDEEDVLEEVFEDVTNNNNAVSLQMGASSRPAPRRSRKSTVGSIGSQNANEDAENLGAIVKKGPKRSRRSTLGSIGSLQDQEVFVMDDVGAGPKETKKTAVRAPKKSKKGGLTLPVPDAGLEGGLLSPNKLSPLTLSGLMITTDVPEVTSPVPLPPGVVCIDLEDGNEEAYFSDIVRYKKIEEEDYACQSNFTKWKLLNYSERRSEQTRAMLLDWIIEVIHYFSAGQECLYNTVHLIDRYVWAKPDQIISTDIQLVGTAAVLLATKLEEYHPADLRVLAKLTQNSVTEEQIRQMELDMLQTLHFNTYCLDPMIFLHRFIRAAFRQDDRMFIEACCLFLDTSITTASYWAITTSKKCAAAVCAALYLIPPPPPVGGSNKDISFWTPTLCYYTGYTHQQVSLLARQMLGILEKTLCLPLETDSGLRVKYKSLSRHCNLFYSTYCRLSNVEKAVRRMTYQQQR